MRKKWDDEFLGLHVGGGLVVEKADKEGWYQLRKIKYNKKKVCNEKSVQSNG